MRQPLPRFRLEVHFSRWEFRARHHLCASDMQTLTLAELLALAEPAERDAWEALSLGYTETHGSPGLREAIASTYDRVAAADVLCFAGAGEGIYAAMQALLTADDHVVTITPNYQSLESIPLTLCEATGVPLDPESAWELDLERVESALRPNTRLLCINFPHNPTGKVLSRCVFDRLLGVARAHGLYVLSDEVYRGVERRPEMQLPQVADCYERGLSLGVMSKAYGLPGLRIGWIACRDSALIRRMEEVKHYLSICNSAPSEVLAIIALKARERILARARALISANLRLLDEFFAEQRELFDWQVPDGGCVGYPRYLGSEGVERFARELVEESGVLLLPASIYRSALAVTPGDRFRIGYGRDHLGEGLAALRRHLDERCVTAVRNAR